MYRSKILKIFIPLLFLLSFTLILASGKLGGNKKSFEAKRLPASGDKSLGDFYRQSQELAREKEQKTTATFLAAGDIMLSRNVAGTIKKAGDPLLPFSKMEGILKSTDFNFANLESPISGSDHFSNTGSLVFNAPTAYVQSLKEYNFKILTLANNHTLDQGSKGLFYTMDFLKGLGIKYIGTGKTLEEAWQPAIVEANGIKVCFVGASYASVNDNGKTTNEYVARVEDLDRLRSTIYFLQSTCDYIVATMHAGTEYTTKPNASQVKFARAAIDYGADMVIGHHPHWVQTIERYCPSLPPSPPLGEMSRVQPSDREGSVNCPNPKYIFYSLGNFIFDQMWSQETREGLAIKIQISKNQQPNQSAPGAATLNDLQGPRQGAKLEQIELIPVIIENYSTPRPATDYEAQKILNKIEEKEKILE